MWSSGVDPIWICWAIMYEKIIAVHLIVAVEKDIHSKGSYIFLKYKDSPVQVSMKPSEVFDSIKRMLNKEEP